MTTPVTPAPRTLVVDLSMKYGGSTSRILSLMQKSASEGILLAALRGSAISREAQKLGIPQRIVGANKTDPRILRNLVRLIRAEKIQLLDTQNIQSKFWASAAAAFTDVALVSTINSWYASEHGRASLKGRLYTALELATNRSLDLYITVSARDRQSLLASGIAADRIELIYNAVDIRAEDIPGGSAWLRHKFSIPAGRLVCTAVGRLVPVKGYDVLVEAAGLLAREAPHLHLLLVGDGESRQALADQIGKLALRERVTLAGYQDREQVLSILRSSDMFVMPSRYEGTPIALLEAGALGLPIVASNVGGIPELVRDGQEALLVPAADSQALTCALSQLANDRDLAGQLGHRAAQRVKDEFHLGVQVQKTWDAYRKALSRHEAAGQ
ncbi:MAG: glycosyltransferase family 4 protein [Chloroflexi bacterium]|nr:glycosyltransferase family 4 protein [Chloroflexota bacterium]